MAEENTNIPPRPAGPLLGTVALGAICAYGAVQGYRWLNSPWDHVAFVVCVFIWTKQLRHWLHCSAFWSAQRVRQRDAIDPAPVHGDDALANTEDVVRWNMQHTAGLLIAMLDGNLIRYDPFRRGSDHSHGFMASFGGPGSGKTSCMVRAVQLTWPSQRCRQTRTKPGSLVVVDVKGSETDTTANYRATVMGQRVLVLDPWDQTKFHSDSFNPFIDLLEELERGGDDLIELAIEKAAILIEEPDTLGENAIFLQSGQDLAALFLIWLAVFSPTECNPVGLRRLAFANRETLQTVAIDLKNSDLMNGALVSLGEELDELLAPETKKLFTSFRRYLKSAMTIWSPASKLGKSTMGSDFALGDVLDGHTTLYISIPSSKLRTHASWVQLLFVSLFNAIAQADEPTRLLVLADEAAYVMPKQTFIAMAQLRSKGLRMWAFVQSHLQLQTRFNKETADLFLDLCSFKQHLSVSDVDQAEELSKASGTRTQGSWSQAQEFVDGQPVYSSTFVKEEKPVLSATDVLQAPRETCFIRMDGRPITVASLVPWWRFRQLRGLCEVDPHEGGPPDDDPAIFNINL